MILYIFMIFCYELIMKRKLPSLIALECFEAVMTHGHVTRAAETLNLTQSAVSRQIKSLETFVRQPLFARERKRLVPTEAAKQFAKQLTPLLTELEKETLRLITWSAYDRVLTLGLLPTFGSRWLIPRLSRFTGEHPEIQINIVTGLTHEDFVEAGTDVAIQYGNGNWPGFITHKLVEETVVAAIAPAAAPDDHQPSVSEFDQLHMRTRPDAWRQWAEVTGTEISTMQTGTRFENFTMMIEATRAGLGAAILPEMYIREDIENGQLVSPFGAPVQSPDAYHFVYAERHAGTEKIEVFKNWLLSEAS